MEEKNKYYRILKELGVGLLAGGIVSIHNEPIIGSIAFLSGFIFVVHYEYLM